MLQIINKLIIVVHVHLQHETTKFHFRPETFAAAVNKEK